MKGSDKTSKDGYFHDFMRELQLLPDYLKGLQEQDQAAKYHLLVKDGAPQIDAVLAAAGAEEDLSSFHGLYVCLGTSTGETKIYTCACLHVYLCLNGYILLCPSFPGGLSREQRVRGLHASAG